MGRPEPCVLFSQTFVHPQLDEYVDEVLFAEPIVITACEFLEQNATSASQAVSLVGATSPPSFALEVFVQCEGETRFRRLCQPFLYSHSSSNVLEVEAVVTSHLVVRGSYRSLSLVIYGNTAEDLGQFNIEFDDSSLTNLVSSAEGKLDDLPLALHSANRTVDELISLNVLSMPIAAADISIEVRQFLQLVARLLELPNLEGGVHEVVNTVVSAVCSCVPNDSQGETGSPKDLKIGASINAEELPVVIREGIKDLLQVLQRGLGDESAEVLADWTFLESEDEVATSKQLVDMLSMYTCFNRSSTNTGNYRLPQTKNIILGMSLALLLCLGRDSCFHYVNSGGMGELAHFLCDEQHNSSAIILLVLGVIEQATRHPIGCEGTLGWWPREDDNIPSGISECYSQLLKLVLEKSHHNVASLATYVLNRLRIYEIASRYENSVLSILGSLSAVGSVTNVTVDMLNSAKYQLKKLLKLINLRGPVEDPSLVASASRSLILGQTEGLLSYKATSSLIGSSNCCFSSWDVDSHLLSLLKDRGFLPLSLALLSSPILRSEVGDITDTFIDIGSTIGAILLSLLMCRSGLMFLLHHPELSAMLIDALKGSNNLNREECVPLRYASILLSKGFVCSPQEIGLIVEMHLRVVNAIDRLLISTPHSEEFLWVLWELCALSRSDCGRQALLVLGYFPEAVSILIEALHSVKEPESVSTNYGGSPVNLAIFHSAAEIFEVIVTDSTASSLDSWIGHAMELHKALHSSSPGSNRKDAPTRLLEWIDAGVVYHKNGAVGLLRYSAVLASGGDAHINSTNILVSDFTDVENVVGDNSSGSEINVMDNLAKVVSEDGDPLRDSSIAQLTTAIRILAFISGNSTVAAALYDEGATIVIYAILVKCSFMLEKSSNNHDYLVDEGTECNSTSDLLLERNREQSLVDLLVPSLVLLINLFHKLQEAKEQHRNTKLMNALLRLHREVSPKLAACAADLSSSYPDFALGFGAVCHLVVSALACWPLYGWTPGLFHSLLSNVQAGSLLAFGPKETCSLLCLLNDLFPEEGVWLWKDGMPLLSALRTLAVGTLLGPQKERQVNWYLEPSHRAKLLSQLSPYLDKIAQIIQHYAVSELVVIQDMLRVFITRIACQKPENASLLLRPILSCIRDQVADFQCQSDVDAYKVYRYLEFLAGVLEHPCAKALLLKEGVVQILGEVLDRCFAANDSDGQQILDNNNSAKSGLTLVSWCYPVFKSFSLLGGSRMSFSVSGRHDLYSFGTLSTKDWASILPHLLRFCQVLPVGKELLSCLASFEELGSCNEGRSAFLTTLRHVNNNEAEPELEKVHERNGDYNLERCECRRYPSLLDCWKKLLKSIESSDRLSIYAIGAVSALSKASLCLCFDGKSVNVNAVKAMKCLYGISSEVDGTDGSEQNISFIQEMPMLLGSRPIDEDGLTADDAQNALNQALESSKILLSLLQNPTGSVTYDDIMGGKETLLSPDELWLSSKKTQMVDARIGKADDYLYVGLGEKFLWECPETLPDRVPQLISGKRKLPSVDAAGKRIKGDNSAAETTGQSAYSRGSGPSSIALGPTRRDTFRQRKPNTSRPPSMHVDDYVARERNTDGVTNSNVIAVQRVGSSGGRPPSIHVDEFMARQRERQNPTAAIVGEPSTLAKNAVNSADKEKINRSKPLKTDLDDDLQGIDIVFDGEESVSDDKLPFPQLDDNLQQPAPVISEQRSPHSIVEETESDVNESSQFPHSGTQLMSHVDENTQSEISSRMSVLRPEMPLTREPSVSSDKKFFDQSDDLKNVNPVHSSTGFDSVQATSTSGLRAQSPVDSRMTQHNFYMKNSPQNVSGSRGIYDRKIPLNQPPLPPMPPPSAISNVMSQTVDPGPSHSSSFVNTVAELQQPPHPVAFQVQSEYLSAFGNNNAQLASSLPMPESKYSRNSISSPGGSGGPHPPLPPTPPPFSSSPYNLPSLKASTPQSSAYNSGTSEIPQTSIPPIVDTRLGNLSVSGSGPSSYTPPPLMPPMVFSRTATVPAAFFGGTPGMQQVDNPNIFQNLPQPIHQLQPLQPPLQRPPQPPQHLWPPVQPSQPLEQGLSLQQMQVHQLQLLQQSQVSQMQTHYSAQQQEHSQSRQQQHVQHNQPHGIHQQGDASQQQQDLGMSLQEYFKDPEAITSLLSNKEELCRLLEQHPKLMQMLQERLGQQ